jgi:hypothetical protein
MRNAEANGDRGWRLRPPARKSLLVVHIASGGAWIGMDVVMGVLVFTALGGDDATKALCFRALELFAGWPLIVTGLICLVSGILLGLGSVYGLIRYWWVVVKLVLNVILVVLVSVLLRPGVVELAEQGRRFDAGLSATLAVGQLVFPPIVSTSALIFATILAVFKPWGLIRKRQTPPRDAR